MLRLIFILSLNFICAVLRKHAERLTGRPASCLSGLEIDPALLVPAFGPLVESITPLVNCSLSKFLLKVYAFFPQKQRILLVSASSEMI
jgi:hypothetical protein